jgi:hypothetical protein
MAERRALITEHKQLIEALKDSRSRPAGNRRLTTADGEGGTSTSTEYRSTCMDGEGQHYESWQAENG